MIQQLREHSKNIFFKLLLGFIAITFVISFGVGTFFGDRKEVLATVNSQELLLQEYQRFYNQQLETFRSRFGANADQLAEQLNLRQQVLQELINRYLLIDAATKEGLQVTDRELSDHIHSLAYFHKDGNFDFETYQQILRQNRLTTTEYEDQLRIDMLAQKYQTAFLQGIVVSDAEVEINYKNQNETFDVSYIYFDPASFIDQVTHTPEELKEFYEANPKTFEQPKQYQIDYFTLTLDQFKDTAVIKERAITRYYEKNLEQYTTPAEVKARHILFKAGTGESEAEKSAKQKQAEEIWFQLKEGGNFEELAKQHSEDLTKDKGGDLGWFKPGEMVSSFEDAAFALEPGQISDVVESPFGFHIIRVDDKKPEKVQELSEVRSEIEETLKEARAEKKLNLEYSRLEERMQEENDLMTIAKSFNTTTTTTDFFDQTSIVPELGSTRALIEQLALRKVGDYGRLKRNPVQGYVFYKILEIKEPTTRPFDSVEEEVIRLVKERKARSLAAEIAQRAANALTTESTLESIAQAHQLTAQKTSFTANATEIPGIGRDPEFQKKVLALKAPQKFGGSQYQGKTYLFHLNKRYLPEDGNIDSKKAVIRQRLLSKLRQAISAKDMLRLRAAAKIEILNPYFRDTNTVGT